MYACNCREMVDETEWFEKRMRGLLRGWSMFWLAGNGQNYPPNGNEVILWFLCLIGVT